MKRDPARLVVYALRHDPAFLGLTLDRQGYSSIQDLIKGLRLRGCPADEALILRISENERFSLDPSRTRMRADYGHTLGLRLEDMFPSDSTPPPVLYHGTALPSLDGIREEGILCFAVKGKKPRDHIFLTELPEVAMKKGARHGRFVVLPVRCDAMHADGYRFYHAKNDIWLTGRIPREYIDFSAMLF